MDAYRGFAGIYDLLMDDFDYPAWADYYMQLIAQAGIQPQNLCDCACGTGAMTVQFIGGARLLETAAGIPYETGLIIFGVSIALYTAFGGFRASVLNDTLQGMVMLIGTIVLLVGIVHAAGGLTHAVETLEAIDPKLVSPQGADDIILSETEAVEFYPE